MFSERQLDALCELKRLGSSALGTYNRSTIRVLIRGGLVESFVPEATTLAAAERGRVHHYRLTDKGVESTKYMYC